MQAIIPTKIGNISQGGLCAEAFKWFQRTDGNLDRDPFNNLVDIIQRSHVSVIEDVDKPPTFYFVGARSPAADVFGRDWAETSTGQAGLPDEPAEKLCNPAYFTAYFDQIPQSHRCVASFKKDGTTTVMDYNRLLMRVSIRSGVPLVLCVADALHIHKYN